MVGREVVDEQVGGVKAAALGLADVEGMGPGAVGSAGVAVEEVEGLAGLRPAGGAVGESGGLPVGVEVTG